MSDHDHKPSSTTDRRAVLTGAAVGAAGLAFAGTARAQSATTTKTSPTGQRFDGKVVLITGATSGIGRATAEEFAREGADVVFCGRRAELGAQVARGINEAGGKAEYSEVDVRDREQLTAWIDSVAERRGRIDIAFNNAGIAIPPGPIEQVTPEDHRDMVATNLDGVFWSMHAQVPHMKRRGGGVIVNTSSAFGSHAPNTQVPYGATKGAIDAMTAGVSKEVAGDGIRVLAVAPGAVVDTDLFRFMGRDYTQEEVQQFGGLHAVGRAGRPIDIARMVLTLASDDAGFVTGTTVPVDGQFLQA